MGSLRSKRLFARGLNQPPGASTTAPARNSNGAACVGELRGRGRRVREEGSSRERMSTGTPARHALLAREGGARKAMRGFTGPPLSSARTESFFALTVATPASSRWVGSSAESRGSLAQREKERHARQRKDSERQSKEGELLTDSLSSGARVPVTLVSPPAPWLTSSSTRNGASRRTPSDSAYCQAART